MGLKCHTFSCLSLLLLMSVINAFGAQWYGHISISCHIHLTLELLLRETILVTSLLASTVL